MNNNYKFDVVILGAGVAGLAIAQYVEDLICE